MLQIVQKHAPGVFEPNELKLLADVFDHCWARYEKSGAKFGSDRAKEAARERLGRAIIEAARQGERDKKKLCDDALLRATRNE